MEKIITIRSRGMRKEDEKTDTVDIFWVYIHFGFGFTYFDRLIKVLEDMNCIFSCNPAHI